MQCSRSHAGPKNCSVPAARLDSCQVWRAAAQVRRRRLKGTAQHRHRRCLTLPHSGYRTARPSQPPVCNARMLRPPTMQLGPRPADGWEATMQGGLAAPGQGPPQVASTNSVTLRPRSACHPAGLRLVWHARSATAPRYGARCPRSLHAFGGTDAGCTIPKHSFGGATLKSPRRRRRLFCACLRAETAPMSGARPHRAPGEFSRGPLSWGGR